MKRRGVANMLWGNVKISNDSGIQDALADGKTYGRKNAEWVEIKEYKWNIHTPGQIVGYLNDPSNIRIYPDGSGDISESYNEGDIIVAALNENGCTQGATVPAFDILEDTTHVYILWESPAHEGYIEYRIFNTLTGKYTDVDTINVNFLNLAFQKEGVPQEQNTAAIFQNAFEIKNEDTVQFVGKGVDVETEIAENDEDENDTSKKIVHIIKQQSDWDEDDVENPNFIKNKPKSVSSYTYVAYASDNSGTGFSLTPTDLLKYRAEIHVTNELNPPTEADFNGATWVKYIGDDGEDGGGGGGSDAPELHLDFEEAGDEFVYNVPYNMKFTSMVSEGTDATLDVALNTVMARYDRLTITATAGGLVSLYGVYI